MKAGDKVSLVGFGTFSVVERGARMVKTEMGIHCYQKKRKWYWSVQPEEGAMNGSQV